MDVKIQNVVLYYILLLLHCMPGSSLSGTDSVQNSGVSLTVGKRSLCVKEKQYIRITCSLFGINVNDSKTIWNITWFWERSIRESNVSTIVPNNNTIISVLSTRVNWTSKDKVFTCLAEFKRENYSAKVKTLSLNSSVTLSKSPKRTRIVGGRFIETIDGGIVELYWKQSEDVSDKYNLRCRLEDEDDYESCVDIEIECSNREHDVYRVPNTTGAICKASIKSVFLYMEYRMSIITTRGQCRSTGPIKKFELAEFGEDNDPLYLLVMTPQQVSMFSVRVAKERRVFLAWTNHPNASTNRKYLLRYNCSELQVNGNKTTRETNLTLYSEDFSSYLPHAQCRFCVQACLSEVWSEPVCRDARLHEEAPSEPPKITCSGDDCATSTDGRYRNVNVTWALPRRQSWNGVLTHVLVRYHTNNGSNVFNRSENFTRRFSVLPRLARNRNYVVQMALCNSVGCSVFGDALQLLAFSESQRRKDTENSPLAVPLGVSLAVVLVVVVVIVVIVVIVLLRRKAKKERSESEQQLPNLQEMKDHYDNIFLETDKDYDVLSDDESEQVGCNGTLPASQETSS